MRGVKAWLADHKHTRAVPCTELLRVMQALAWQPRHVTDMRMRVPPRNPLGSTQVQPTSCCDLCWHGYRPAAFPLTDDDDDDI